MEERSDAMKLELKRVDLIYRQNIPGVVALIIYSLSYVYGSMGIISNRFLAIWFSILLISGVVRLIVTKVWFHKRDSLTNLRQINKWHVAIQGLLLVSGCGWGTIGWMLTQSDSATQQILTTMSIIFMSAGSIVCYSASMKSMLCVILPATLPWIAGLLLSNNPKFIFMGGIGGLYVLLGLFVARTLNRWVEESFRLNIEKSRLASHLKKEVEEKTRAEVALIESQQRLRLALESSDAATWAWDISTGVFTCEGNLKASFGLLSDRFKGTIEDYLKLIHPDDRRAFDGLMKKLLEAVDVIPGLDSSVEFDAEPRVVWPDGSVHYVAHMGRTHLNEDAKPVRITGICWDITDKKFQEKMRIERDVHEAANKAKSLFLANASHEIRTPLTAISGFAESLLNQTTVEGDVRNDIGIILRNGKYLSSLVDDLLDLSKIETGRLHVQRTLLSPKTEIEDAMTIVRSSAEAKKLSLDLAYENEIPEQINYDGTRFRQILINLLSNAVKFTDDGGVRIRVRYDSGLGRLYVRVADTGIGINAKVKEQLFTPFLRDNSPEVQRVQGSGLGLALSRSLACKLGGDLRLVRTSLGRGSEFEFIVDVNELPNVRVEEPVGKVQVPPMEDRSWSVRPLPLMGAKILVVDDSEDLTLLMRRHLEREGAEIETCENGVEAIRLASSKSYDLILMDINMPIMDGYSATMELRKMGYTRPIVALTAHASAEHRNLCFCAGCDDYIGKPVDRRQLIATVAKRLGRRSSLDVPENPSQSEYSSA